jgi:hypothetical protein
MIERIELGATVKHKLTGFQGTVSGRTDYLHGSSVLLVTSPELKDGAPNMHWLEESGLVLVVSSKS